MEADNLFSTNLDYTKPIVDHLKTYSEARKKLSVVRKKAGFKEEASEIRELIASRKNDPLQAMQNYRFTYFKREMLGFLFRSENLKVITPDYMGFDIVEGGDCRMYQGQIIGYKVSPLIGVKVSWVTEITHVRENEFFVDEQRFGPYKFWHHKHFFKEIQGRHALRRRNPLFATSILFAPLLNALIIKNKLEGDF